MTKTRQHHIGQWITTLVLSLLVWVLPAWVGVAEAQELGVRVAHGGDAQFSGGDLSATGDGLVAWRSTDQGWSKVQLLKAGTVVADWEFSDLLVKDVRWMEAGKSILVRGIESDGGAADRLYDLDSGSELTLRWNSRSIRVPGDATGYTDDGRYWFRSRFETEQALVSLGRVGEEEVLWTWRLDAGQYGAPTAFAAEQYSSTTPLPTHGKLSVAILWGGRLWLGQAFDEELVPVRPAEGCVEIREVAAVAIGFWSDCGREFDPTKPAPPGVPSTTWAFYPSSAAEGSTEIRPASTTEFRSPIFQADGTVLDVYRQGGRAEIFDGLRAETSLPRVAGFPLPGRARIFKAGDALLVEVADSSDDFRVLSLGPQLP